MTTKGYQQCIENLICTEKSETPSEAIVELCGTFVTEEIDRNGDYSGDYSAPLR